MFQVQFIFVLSNKCIYLLLWDEKEKDYHSQIIIFSFRPFTYTWTICHSAAESF